MGTLQPWTNSPRTAGQGETNVGESTSQTGLLEQSRNFLLGGKASQWLRENEAAAFASADECLSQAAEVQSVVRSILDDYQRGIVPQVTKNGEDVDMTPLQFADRIVGLANDSAAVVEKALTIRNKVATGGTNILTAALMGSNAMQFAAARKER